MNKSVVFLAVIISAALLLPGCASAYPAAQPVPGFLFSEITSAANVTSADVGSKSGMSKAESFLGWVATGDSSINTAAASAGISRISHVDYKVWSILGIYARVETYVYGD